MILNRNQKKELVIKLYEEGKTTREIAKEVRISLRDIGIILKEYNKVPEPEKPKSNRARAIQMFLEGKQPVEVITTLDIKYEEVIQYYNEYLSLIRMSRFLDIYKKYGKYLSFITKVIDKMVQRQILENDVDTLLYFLDHFKDLNNMKNQLQHMINCLILRKNVLEDESLNS
jgi:hypothetical protein